MENEQQILEELKTLNNRLDNVYKFLIKNDYSESFENMVFSYLAVGKENFVLTAPPEFGELYNAIGDRLDKIFPEKSTLDNSNSNVNLKPLIDELKNNSKDDRNSFNMLVNTLKDTNMKEDFKELKALTVSTNDLLVKQVNAQNQFNAGCFVFGFMVISVCVFKFAKNLFAGLF